jgi:hypothetical protein
MEIKRKQKEINDLKKDLEQYMNGDKKIEDEFGKSLEEIIEEYRQLHGRKTLLQSKSAKMLQPWKEEGTKRTPHMEEKNKLTKNSSDYKREDKRKGTVIPK